ncbi:MAG: RNA polymerase sigma factor, partial [Planctomycetota bacterium]|jgi:RNA polymerase sigma-70 factor (ECF subfamily)
MLEDKLLLLKCKRGSSEALEKIYEKYAATLITVATALLNNTQAAEDVLHDFFVSFVQSIEKVKLSGSLKAYMVVCVANLAKNRLKRRQLEPVLLNEGSTFQSRMLPPDVKAMQAEQTEMLNQALSQLPFEQKEAIVLHLQADMKFTEIAKLRSTSADTIRSRYRYGLENLRSLVNSEVSHEIA